MEFSPKNITPSSTKKMVEICTILFVLIFLGYFIIITITSFSKYYFQLDPEIAYMFSSLSIFKGNNFVYIDHPGTPFEILGFILLLATYPFTLLNSETFVSFHLNNPAYFLTFARFSLLIFSSITLYFLAKETAKKPDWLNQLKIFTVISSFYAFHPDSFQTLTLWSHHSINLPGGTLVLLSSWLLLNKEKRTNIYEKVIIGFLCGSLTAFHIYFSTWAVGALISYSIYEWLMTKHFRSTLLSVLIIGFSSLGGFLAMTLPILKSLPRFFSFLFEIASHSGLYGTGFETFTTPTRYLSNLIIYINELKWLFIVIFTLITVITIIILKWETSNGVKAYSLGVFFQFFISLAIILKHPLRIYFLSLATTIPILFIIFFDLLDRKKDWKILELNIQKIKYIANYKQMIILFVFTMVLFSFSKNFIESINAHLSRIEYLSQQEKSIEDFTILYSTAFSLSPEDIIILWTYETNSPCTARWFGNYYGDLAFTDELMKICDKNFSLSLWENKILTDQGMLTLDSYPWDFIVIKDWMIIENAFPKVLQNGYIIDLESSDLSVIVRNKFSDKLE